MEEIYWITRLDSIHTFVFVSILSSIIVFAGTGFFCIIESSEHHCDKELVKKVLKYCKSSFVIFFILLLLKIFIPTTKEAFAIWGVGNVIDYVQTNETVKQLSDKAIEALDLWVDNYLETDSIK